MRNLKAVLFGLLLGVTLDVAAFSSYNYFAPGGALSCTGSCTAQSVNLAAGASFITGTLPSANLPAIGANPTAVVGLTVVNGSASTCVRSDASPALDQGITPNWTGAHTFSQPTTYTFVAGGGSGPLQLQSAGPVEEFKDTSAGTDAKRWEFDAAQVNHFRIYALSDSGAANTFLSDITRSGVNITDVKWGNTGANPTTEFQGTGLVTFSGSTRYNAPEIGGGTTASPTGCGTVTGILGGAFAGSYLSATTGTCTVTIALPAGPTNGYACYAHDDTTAVDYTQSAIVSTVTTLTISGTTVSGDKIVWACPLGY